ncbi:hypothetical protein BHM03_00025428 [Ensete ventricosum]|nr:hypothetical protein BHM03_00025428 [Ensete ventricosum]
MDGVGMVQTLPSGAGEKVVGKKCLPQGFSGKEEEPSIEVARLNEEGSSAMPKAEEGDEDQEPEAIITGDLEGFKEWARNNIGH